MLLIKGIYTICQIDTLTTKQKLKAIKYGIIENLINAPKRFVWLVSAMIGLPFVLLNGLFYALGEFCELAQTPFENICIKIKNSDDKIVTPPEFEKEYKQALKQYLQEKRATVK